MIMGHLCWFLVFGLGFLMYEHSKCKPTNNIACVCLNVLYQTSGPVCMRSKYPTMTSLEKEIGVGMCEALVGLTGRPNRV